jgi:hypothetical protein
VTPLSFSASLPLCLVSHPSRRRKEAADPWTSPARRRTTASGQRRRRDADGIRGPCADRPCSRDRSGTTQSRSGGACFRRQADRGWTSSRALVVALREHAPQEPAQVRLVMLANLALAGPSRACAITAVRRGHQHAADDDRASADLDILRSLSVGKALTSGPSASAGNSRCQVYRTYQ